MTRKSLDVAIVLLATSLLLIVALGGVDYDWGMLRIRLHDWERPLALLVVALATRFWLAARNGFKTPGDASRNWWHRAFGPVKSRLADRTKVLYHSGGSLEAISTYVATCGLLSVILATAVLYATYQVRVAGGLDSYGYVSTASLISSGRLSEPQPLVPLLPFENASSAAAPLGYVAGVDGHTQVPRFPIGLPVVMALFKIFGANGPFFVPLVMAYFTIALAFLLAGSAGALGKRETLIGLFAATLVSIDPLMADSAIQPMSDVPAACWLLAAVWLRLDIGGCETGGSERTRRTYVGRILSDPAMLAGFCAGMAFLTRPALLLAAIALGVVTLDRPARETVRFGVTLGMFVALQMAINLGLYGNIRVSGYGPASYMFELSLSRLADNAMNFGKWLSRSHSVVFWLLWPGALAVLRHRKWAWQISAVAAAAALPYLFYLVFDDWESSRFLLPTILLILILASMALGRILAQRWAGPLLLVAIALACAVASHRFLQQEGVDRLRDVEAKYALAGEWIKEHTPARAVVLAGLHSGSIRFYGNRQTIRWDEIPPDRLTATLRNLQGAGYDLYLALDVPTEPPLFTDRFAFDPAIRIEQIGRVRVVNIYRFVSAH